MAKNERQLEPDSPLPTPNHERREMEALVVKGLRSVVNELFAHQQVAERVLPVGDNENLAEFLSQ